jgi:hypothetical protein
MAVLLLMVAGSGTAAFASGNGGPPPPDGTVAVTLGSTYSDVAVFGTSLGALPDSVSVNIYAVTGPASISITILDFFAVGDYYELWESSSPAFSSPTLVGTTPQVKTDTNIVAPSFNPLWDGTGSTHSTGTFIVSVPSGTTYFAVRDAIQGALGAALLVSPFPCGTITLSTLLSSGCTATGVSVVAGVFLVAGFTVAFANAPSQGVPEFDSPSFLLAALALPFIFLLRGRVGAKHRPW